MEISQVCLYFIGNNTIYGLYQAYQDDFVIIVLLLGVAEILNVCWHGAYTKIEVDFKWNVYLSLFFNYIMLCTTATP